ncbi:carboxymuconolactone decarboxylase family protein [Streptomyces yaizuensis]|uniref:Carboxymuconolactone decarboxylase family protein n=1 Tax=Streptomyces yaizuensis TaxID=2989713 RepID=A0ABQ5P8A8_9ACTN|nr:carboxymuconolactone decarboxylase family protein [Streptomyces sp. YSPA8]GLF98800.1 carboxymuconolactone decarboxylase family protein [Streptomyces sp. YSPA8]
MRPLVRTVLRGSLDRIHHVAAVRPAAARGTVAAVYAQAERDFGALAPPVALHSPHPGVLAAAWTMLRETLLVEGRVGRAAKETVATAVSEANSCPYCAEVHGAAADAGGGRPAGRLADWVRDGGAATGPPPGPPDRAPELIGTAVTFHYLNRMVNVFLDGSPLPPALPPAARGTMLRVVAGALRSREPGGPAPGVSRALLPAAPLPGDLAWAAPRPHIAGAFARAAAAIGAAGESALPGPTRELVLDRLAGWDGAPLGPGRPDGPAAALAPAARPAARLALLTALASYRVTPADIAAVRADDRTLVGITAWASLAAARRAGALLAGEG